ncbi:F-box domain-containing protein [Heracleum sosnowskyi]|uniref:F-box domain-containing protein n=1 Tax=Heracleum sosnowskyi TaxID=360622 RepID=A0AAD8MBC0_9APIA|nr:F-box domain-containing protein [Heracleum sosnowskyi]
MLTTACASTVSSPVPSLLEGYLGGSSYITDDLVNNILLLLPVKHLLRCRCVCKSWCSLIDSTTFVKKHLQKNIECNHSSGIVCTSDSGFYLADVDSLSDIIAVEVPDPLKTFLSGTLFVGSCNGLVCLWNYDHKVDNDIYLWNPAIRKATQLPKPLDHVRFPSLLLGSALVGFGYDNVNDDYKVMTTVDSRIWGIMVAVYSFKGNSWTRAETITNRYRISGHFGKYANGSLYWIASKESDIIFAYDLGVERHRELSFPDGVDQTDDNDMSLTVLNDCLCLVDIYFNSHAKLYLLNNTEMGNSWSKLFSVEQPGIFGSFGILCPVALSKSQNDILLRVDEDILMWYNFVRNEVKNVTIHGFPSHLNLFAYTKSLVQPCRNFKVDRKQKQKEKMIDVLCDGFKLM